MPLFPPVAPRLPEGKHGAAEVSHFTVGDREDAAYIGFLTRTFDMRPGTYARLYVDGALVMSDTPFEHRTNGMFYHRAYGAVLIAGLGLGMVLPPLLAHDRITHVTVVERSPDVVALVGPSVAHPKLTLVTADIRTWRPPPGTRYDTLYFDIWPTICEDNLPEVARLHRAFARYKAPGAWMASWMADELRARRRADRRRYGGY